MFRGLKQKIDELSALVRLLPEMRGQIRDLQEIAGDVRDEVRKSSALASDMRAMPSQLNDLHTLKYLFPDSRDHAYAARMISHGSDQFMRDEIMLLLGQIATRQRPKALKSIREAEFRVFSQFGEDGILQYLVDHIQPRDRRFIEFGAQHYDESNTRFLLAHGDWNGLVLDNSQAYIDHINEKYPSWKYNLAAQCAHLTTGNINQIFRDAGYEGRIGLLSIDIDSFDYYMWDAVTVVQPDIVVIEYNRNFPAAMPITIPHQATFDRFEAHPSRYYWGASLGAHYVTAKKKGYQFVGTESHQRNAFFVRQDVAAGLPSETPGEKHQKMSAPQTLKDLAGLKVFNVESGETTTL